MTYVKPITMVIIALDLKGIQFGEVVIPFVLVNALKENFKVNIRLIIYSVWFLTFEKH